MTANKLLAPTLNMGTPPYEAFPPKRESHNSTANIRTWEGASTKEKKLAKTAEVANEIEGVRGSPADSGTRKNEQIGRSRNRNPKVGNAAVFVWGGGKNNARRTLARFG